MKASWLIAAILFITINISVLWAEDVIFIAGAEIDGVKVGSFYLSTEEITNQEYLIFIQKDGYKKKYLWDYGAIQIFDRFKNAQGDTVPRSWKGMSPPVDQESQAVIGISHWEARAYARSIGWDIPNEIMWKLALQMKPEIGPYPWKDDGDNLSGIRMCRYYVSGTIAENRYAKINEELDKIRKNFAPANHVKWHDSQIQALEKNSATAKDMQEIRNQVQVVSERVNSEKVQNWDKSLDRIKDLEALANKYEASLTKQISLTESLAANVKKVDDRLKDYETLQQDNKNLKETCSNLEKKLANAMISQENWIKKVQTIEEKMSTVEGKLLVLEELSKKFATLTSQVTGIQEITLDLQKKNSALDRENSSLQTAVSSLKMRIDGQEKVVEEIFKQTAKTKAVCDELSNKIKTCENTDTTQNQRCDKIDQELDKANKKSQELDAQNQGMFKQIQMVQKFDVQYQQQFSEIKEELKKHQNTSVKEDISLRESIASLVARYDRQAKDITELFNQSGQMKNITDDLSNKIKKCNEVDNSYSQKSDKLEQNLEKLYKQVQEQEQRDREFQKQFGSIQETDVQNQRKLFDLKQDVNNNLTKQEKKDSEIAASLDLLNNNIEEKIKVFKNEINTVLQSEVNKITKNVNTNYGDLVAIQQKLTNIEKNYGDDLAILKKNIKDLSTKADDLQLELREGSKKLRISMIKIGKDISQLFKVEGMGSLSEKEQEIEETAPAKPEEKPGLKITIKDLEKIVEQAVGKEVAKELPKELAKETQKISIEVERLVKELVAKQEQTQKTEVHKSTVDTTAIAQLCCLLGEIYYRHQNRALALECMQLGLKFDQHNASIGKFFEGYWEKINCPDDMVYIPTALVKLGDAQDPEFADREVTIAAFYIDRHETTRKQFDEFVQSGAYRDSQYWREGSEYLKSLPDWQRGPDGWRSPLPSEENLPVANVNYYEAMAYATWKGKRLPTADEWEYAARGTDKRKFPWGNASYKYYNSNELMSVDKILRDCSPHGVIGMAGNVAEWCAGLYQHMRYDDKAGKYYIEAKKEFRCVKGGSFKSYWFNLQTFYQAPYKPETSLDDIGFRCASPIPKR